MLTSFGLFGSTPIITVFLKFSTPRLYSTPCLLNLRKNFNSPPSPFKSNGYRPNFTTFFCSLWKRNTRTPSKVVTEKSFFSSVYVIGITCLEKYYLLDVITGCDNFNFSKKFIVAFFEAGVLKKALIWYVMLTQFNVNY